MIPNELSALAAARAIAEGSMSSRALTEACLGASISASSGSGRGNSSNSSYACAQADACDALQRAGRPLGPLHGVPSGSKTSSIPRTCRPRTATCSARSTPGTRRHRGQPASCGGRDHPGQDGDGRAGRRPPWQNFAIRSTRRVRRVARPAALPQRWPIACAHWPSAPRPMAR